MSAATVWATPLEIGPNDFRISFLMGSGSAEFDAIESDVAYNATDGEYLVAWRGDRPGCSRDHEIWIRRIDAETGGLLGTPRVISVPGLDCDRQPRSPALVWNGQDNEYLVVWDEAIPGRDHSRAIWGRLVDEDGQVLGSPIEVSYDQSFSPFSAGGPDVAWNPEQQEYLVVASIHGNVRGQRLNANGTLQGTESFYILPQQEGRGAAVAWNGNYLVVAEAKNSTPSFEILGRSVFGDLTLGDAHWFLRVSDVTARDSYAPAITWNAFADEFLVVWHGHSSFGGTEIFGQRLNGSYTEIGADDFRISDMGGTGDNGFDGYRPAVAWNRAGNEYAVVWRGDDDRDGQQAGEDEVFVQFLDSSGQQVGPNDLRISDMGGLGGGSHDARRPAVATHSDRDEYLVVWDGDDDVGGLVEGESEIFGQRTRGLWVFGDGFESGSPSAWQ